MKALGKILIVDDNEDVLFALNLLLEPYAEKVKVTTRPDRITHFMTTFEPDIVLLDMNFSRDAISGQEGFDSLKQILDIDPQAVVIFMTAYADTDKAVKAIKAGATDFISKPWEKEKLLATLSSGMKLRSSQREVNLLKEQVEVLSNGTTGSPDEQIIGDSPAMQEVFSTVEKLSTTDANILILGENGTGKDVIARLLYRHSPRCGKPFVNIDLGSIPEQLFESELFGYEKGAFTDARKPKAGRMEVATGGTLFLDEIGNLSLPMQAKLLTAIEKRKITRLGSTHDIAIDVRLICATNADIHRLVEEGNFRQDLLYRINTIELHIPPLRERGNDILLLAEHFLQRYARKYQKEMRGLTREAKNKLLKYAWPGNVRELQHTMERAVILGDGSLLRPENFLLQSPTASRSHRKEEEPLLNLEQIERSAIERAMRLSEGNLTRAAEYLGITRFALYRKLEKMGL
ncbi:MAG: sigma-54-dependent Fis family transcriptional regulator [Bacteroides sp.]|nr:sigma-54-dependent Fis family transcriptional regulator [Bacteroides sp.]